MSLVYVTRVVVIDAVDRQSKRMYAWEVGPVDDLALLLLCGEPDFKV